MKRIFNITGNLGIYLCLIFFSGCNKSHQEAQPKIAAKADKTIKQNEKPPANEKYSCGIC